MPLDKHAKNQIWFGKRIQRIMDVAVEEATQLGISDEVFGSSTFSFDKLKRSKRASRQIFKKLTESLIKEVNSQSEKSWYEGEASQIRLLDNLAKTTKIPADKLKQYRKSNIDALAAFQKRKEKGISFSKNVWNITDSFKGEMELAIDVALSEGMSAQQLSKDVRKLLKNPDALFRKVRDKNGNLVLSRHAKNYKPGQGVYRSAYKNAMRLSRTENNMAYHSAINAKYAEFDFVVGIRIKLSNNPLHCPFCESMAGDYPKDFIFQGWHPQCRCTTVPILKTEEEMEEDNDRIAQGEQPSSKSVNEVKDLHPNFKNWIDANREKLETANHLPFFARDNRDYVLGKPKKVKQVKTPAQIQAIQSRWDARKAEYTTIKNDFKSSKSVFAAVPNDIDVSVFDKLLSEHKLYELRDKLPMAKAKADSLIEDLIDMKFDIPDIEMFAKEFKVSELKEAFDAAKVKNYSFSLLGIEKQQEKLDFEIKWLEDTKKYPTWKVSQSYLKVKKAKVDFDIEMPKFEAHYKELQGVTKKWKSAKFKELSNELEEAYDLILLDDSADKLLALSQAKIKINNLQEYADKVLARKAARAMKKALAEGGGVNEFAPMSNTEYSSALKDFAESTVASVDKEFRMQTEKVWATLSDEERLVVSKYTETFSYLNEPLRGLPYLGSAAKKAEFDTDMPLLTKVLNKVRTPRDVTVRRGTGDFTIKELGKNLSSLQVGDEFTEGGFLSTAMHPSRGFTHPPYDLVIVLPKGTKGIYAEPFSAYNNGNYSYSAGRIWDGKTVEGIGSEFEWIGQRGHTMRVMKREGKRIFLQVVRQLED